MSTELQNVSIERGEGGLLTLNIEVSPDAVRRKRDHVIREYSRNIRVAGFRPGKIPANIVLRTVGEEAIAQRVSDELVPEAYQQVVEQENLQPLNQAQVDNLTFDAFKGDQPLQFTAKVVVRPEIALPELKELPAQRPIINVTDEDVAMGLEGLQNENATLRSIEGRGAQNGDVLSAELSVFMDGEARSEEPARLRQFVLGESGFIPSIDEHLQGATLDEERRFEVTYPDDFKDEELAGKNAEFLVTITALKERVLPEVNDEFAKKLGLEDMADLRARMKTAIEQGREREAADGVRSQVALAAMQTVEFETPNGLVDARVARRMQNMEAELEQREATIEDYLASIGQSREEFDQELRDDVESEVRQELVLDELAQREGFVVLDEEVEHHYRMMAQAMQRPIEEVVQFVDVNTVRSSILQRKAVDWLVDYAKIEEVPAEQMSDADAADEASVAAEEVVVSAVPDSAGDETIAETIAAQDEA